MKKTNIVVSALFVAAMALALSGPASAMEDIKGHFGIGPSIPYGHVKDVINTGWQLDGGATFYPRNKTLGFRLDLAWDWWDVDNNFLDKIDTDRNPLNGIQPPADGDAQSIATTFNILWEPEHSGSIGFYLTGGLGGYWLYADISELGWYYGYICDPWYWWYCYPTAVQGESEIRDQSSFEWGANAGAAVTFELSSGSQFYIEASYQWVDSKNTAAWIPLTFGWRW